MNSTTKLIAITLLVLLVAHCTKGYVTESQQTAYTFQDLASLNNNSYNFYRGQIASAGPGGFFVLVIKDRVLLVINGKVVGETQAYDDRYRLGHTIANVPVGIYSVLHHQLIYQNKTVVSPTAVTLLQQYSSHIQKAQASLKTWFGVTGNASTAVFAEEAELLKKSFALVNTTLRTMKIDNTTLFNWAQELGLWIPKVAQKTAQYSVIVLHQRFKQLLNSFNITRTHPDWSRFRVVLGLEPNVRINSMFEQYFSRYIGERDYLGRRVITMDLPTGVTEMMNQVSVLIVDNLIGRFFYNDPLQGRRDWLASSANRALDQILEELPEDPNAVSYGQIVFYTFVATCSVVGITIYVIGLTYSMRQYNLLVQEEEERQRMMIKQIKNRQHAENNGMQEVSL